MISLALFLALNVNITAQAAKVKSSLAYQYYSRGVELNSHKKREEALKQFQSAIDLNPSFVTSYLEYARTAVMLQRRQLGLQKLDAALGVARRPEDRERVRRERENLSEIFYTNETFQWYQNGLNFLKLDRAGSAVDALERAMHTEPDNILILTAYARALRQDDRLKDAVAALERALKLNDDKREVRLELAESSLTPDPERAHELLQDVTPAQQDERTVVLDAQALTALKRNREAIELLRTFYDKQPGSHLRALLAREIIRARVEWILERSKIPHDFYPAHGTSGAGFERGERRGGASVEGRAGGSRSDSGTRQSLPRVNEGGARGYRPGAQVFSWRTTPEIPTYT